MCEIERNQRLANALISLGKMLDLQVIAEGVETVLQADRLQECGCPYAQGYLFHKPLPVQEMEAILTNQEQAAV